MKLSVKILATNLYVKVSERVYTSDEMRVSVGTHVSACACVCVCVYLRCCVGVLMILCRENIATLQDRYSMRIQQFVCLLINCKLGRWQIHKKNEDSLFLLLLLSCRD